MRVVCLQHVEYETAEAIATWALERGHDFETARPVFEDYPSLDTFDMLVVMGGPMGAYDDASYPWLVSEKAFIRKAIDSGRLVLGVCLGAQLTACALGGSARRNDVREVGWFPARLTPVGRESRVLSVLPREMVVGLWHGDTYDLPAGLETAMVSDACPNQAFEARDGRVVGLQFHVEWTPEALEALAQRHGEWFEEGGPFVQTREEFLDPGDALGRGRELLFRLLDEMETLR